MAYNRNRSIWFHLDYTEPRFRLSTGEGEISVGPKSKLPGGCDEPSAAAARPLRADAQRNRARILEAAEVVFAAEGIEVPVDTIAEKAGVGVGTLYRHFPTKEKLCEAILLDRLSRPHRSTPRRWPTPRTPPPPSSASSSTSSRRARPSGTSWSP